MSKIEKIKAAAPVIDTVFRPDDVTDRTAFDSYLGERKHLRPYIKAVRAAALNTFSDAVSEVEGLEIEEPDCGDTFDGEVADAIDRWCFLLRGELDLPNDVNCGNDLWAFARSALAAGKCPDCVGRALGETLAASVIWSSESLFHFARHDEGETYAIVEARARSAAAAVLMDGAHWERID